MSVSSSPSSLSSRLFETDPNRNPIADMDSQDRESVATGRFLAVHFPETGGMVNRCSCRSASDPKLRMTPMYLQAMRPRVAK